MIFKLKQLDISGSLLDWYNDYLILTGGHKGQDSEWKLIPAGVPQGHVLRPALFIVYINDLVDTKQCNIKLYADDTPLYIMTEDFQEGSVMLNEDLHGIHDWANQWLLF